jgi:hypothetical protein
LIVGLRLLNVEFLTIVVNGKYDCEGNNMSVQDLMEEVERSRREAMLRNMLDLDQFRTAIQTGALRPITLRAGGFQFWIEGQPRPQPGIKPGAETLLTLCTSRSKRPQWFRNPAAALELLREMGATTVQVELGHW